MCHITVTAYKLNAVEAHNWCVRAHSAETQPTTLSQTTTHRQPSMCQSTPTNRLPPAVPTINGGPLCILSSTMHPAPLLNATTSRPRAQMPHATDVPPGPHLHAIEQRHKSTVVVTTPPPFHCSAGASMHTHSSSWNAPKLSQNYHRLCCFINRHSPAAWP